MRRRRGAAALLLAACFTGGLVAVTAARAEGDSAAAVAPLNDDEVRAVREVVQAQIDALADGDGSRAFAFASPSIHNLFGDAPTFLTMVQQGYPMLIRPSSTLYTRPLPIEGGAVVVVHVVDHDGEAWRATYELQRQPDRSWRIDGCFVVADSAGASI
jgi:hypothetical protein